MDKCTERWTVIDTERQSDNETDKQIDEDKKRQRNLYTERDKEKR
jgi:hypothetical protein